MFAEVLARTLANIQENATIVQIFARVAAQEHVMEHANLHLRGKIQYLLNGKKACMNTTIPNLCEVR